MDTLGFSAILVVVALAFFFGFGIGHDFGYRDGQNDGRSDGWIDGSKATEDFYAPVSAKYHRALTLHRERNAAYRARKRAEKAREKLTAEAQAMGLYDDPPTVWLKRQALPNPGTKAQNGEGLS